MTLPNTRRLSTVAEIGLVVVCWIVAACGALSLISCIRENVDQIPRVCYSPRVGTVYEAVMIAAAAIALIAVVVSHVLDRRRIAQLGCLLSVAMIAAAFIWGFETGAHPAYPGPGYRGDALGPAIHLWRAPAQGHPGPKTGVARRS